MLRGAADRVRRALEEWRYELIIFTSVVLLAAGGAFSQLQAVADDVAFRVATRPPSGDIVLVQIDPRSLAAVDTWPWPRSRHAEVINRLRAAGADLIALDIDFSSPSRPLEDAALGAAIKAAQGRIVLPSFIQHTSRGASDELVETRPLPVLRDNALIGNANIFAPQGEARRASFALYIDETHYRPTFAALFGQKGQAPIREFFIDYGINSAAIPRLSVIDVLNGTFDPAAVKGKRVIVGATAIELGDFIPVPVRGVIPGVELQALIAESILQNRALYSAGEFGTLMLVFLTLAGLRPSRAAWNFRGFGAPSLLATAALGALPIAALSVWPVLVETVPAIAASGFCFVVVGLKELSTRARAVVRERTTGNLRRVMVDLIVDESSDGVIVTDANGRIELCNERAATLLSATRSMLMTRRIDRHLPRFEALSPVEGAEDTQRQGEYEIQFGGDTAMLDISVRRTALPAQTNETEAARIDVYTLRDVTARRRAEAAERRAQEQSLMAERAKANFVANMSHELRTPLNAIIGFSEMMAGQILGPMGQPQYVEFAGDVAKSGRHLLSLVNNILEISRLDHDGSLAIEEIDFNECAAAAAELARASRDAKDQTITVHVSPGAERVRADQRIIKHALSNLLSNAIKFTGAGGTIRINAHTEDDAFVFEVADNGVGIDPALLPHLTDLFRHADSGFTRKHDGMGAGLYLVKRYVDLLKGSLAFESEQGKGTLVRVTLPGAAVRETPGQAEAAA